MMGRRSTSTRAAYAYSNLGYLLLGRVIEAVSGRPYETCVREEVLAPLGIREARLGRRRCRRTDEGRGPLLRPAERTGPGV